MINIFKNLKNAEGFFCGIDTLFKLFFLFISILSYNSFTHGTLFMKLIVVCTGVLAAFLAFYKLINFKNYISNKFLWLLIAFMASFLLSALVNYKYGLIAPIKTAVWIGMQYFLLFALDTKKDAGHYKKQFKIISAFYLTYIVLANIASLVLLVIRFNSIQSESKLAHGIAGFVWGRLWGVYTDPNVGSVMTIIAVIISLYFYLNAKKKSTRVWLIIGAVINLLYITFSDSRTGFVAIVLSFGAVAYFLLWSKGLSVKPLLNQVLCIVLALTVGLGTILTTRVVKTSYKSAVDFIASHSDNVTDGEKVELETQFDSRENDLESDVSNQRFDLWGAAIKTFTKSPLFGTSFDNFKAFSKEYVPDSYLINNKGGGEFDRYHNMVFDILVAQGAVGIIIFLILGVTAGLKALKNVTESLKKKNKVYYVCLLGILLCALTAGLFTSDIFYINTPVAAMFWISLGLVLKTDNEGEKDA